MNGKKYGRALSSRAACVSNVNASLWAGIQLDSRILQVYLHHKHTFSPSDYAKFALRRIRNKKVNVFGFFTSHNIYSKPRSRVNIDSKNSSNITNSCFPYLGISCCFRRFGATFRKSKSDLEFARAFSKCSDQWPSIPLVANTSQADMSIRKQEDV